MLGRLVGRLKVWGGFAGLFGAAHEALGGVPHRKQRETVAVIDAAARTVDRVVLPTGNELRYRC